jgi:hypothetical protein
MKEELMRKFALSGVAAGLFGGAMLLSGGAPASAASLPAQGFEAPGETAVIQVQRRERERSNRWERRRDRADRRERHASGNRNWDRNRHGPRYSHRRHGFQHFHGGYWYSTPWWIGPSISLGLSVPSYGYGGGHVEWCLNRYRSYDPGSDTYMGYDGYRHRCNSPFV